MIDLSRPWPFGIGTRSWWKPALGAVLAILAAALVDQGVSAWAQGLPLFVRAFMEAVTGLGLSEWILYPSFVLFIITVALARFARWRLMRTLLWQFSALYAFTFIGIGMPNLATFILKNLVGRGRPMQLSETGVFGLRPNLFDWAYQSFPSGHSTTIFALAMVTAFLSPRLFYPSVAIAIVVGFSRIVLGDHYPSDVIAGAVIGVLGAYAARWLFARRGWLFVNDAGGNIRLRPMSAIKRYVAIKQRGIAPAPRPDRP